MSRKKKKEIDKVLFSTVEERLREYREIRKQMLSDLDNRFEKINDYFRIIGELASELQLRGTAFGGSVSILGSQVSINNELIFNKFGLSRESIKKQSGFTLGSAVGIGENESLPSEEPKSNWDEFDTYVHKIEIFRSNIDKIIESFEQVFNRRKKHTQEEIEIFDDFITAVSPVLVKEDRKSVV